VYGKRVSPRAQLGRSGQQRGLHPGPAITDPGLLPRATTSWHRPVISHLHWNWFPARRRRWALLSQSFSSGTPSGRCLSRSSQQDYPKGVSVGNNFGFRPAGIVNGGLLYALVQHSEEAGTRSFPRW